MPQGVSEMTPLEMSFYNPTSSLLDVARLLGVCLLIALPFAITEYLRSKCYFGHRYSLVEARNDNGAWTAKRKCVRCGATITEISDTAHFRIGDH